MGTSSARGSSFRRGVARLGSLDARWEDGIWLGRRWGGITHIVVAGPDEALEVRAVMRRPLSERWSREELQAIRVAPWVWRAAGAPGADEAQVIPHVEPVPEAQPPPAPPPTSLTRCGAC